jgi:hypothetical protein
MWAVLVVACFALAVVLHAALGRVRLRLSAVMRYLAVGSVLGAGLTLLLFVLYGFSPQALAGVLSYMLISELYIFLFTLVHSSISAIILRSLYAESMTAEALDGLCNPASMTDARLHKLQASGFLIERDGRYRLTPQADRTIVLFGRLRSFFRHDRRTGVVSAWQAEISGQEPGR